jgi:lysophospholipase L1-like esterase
MRVLVFGASSAQGYWDSQGGWADRLKHYYDGLQMQDLSVDVPKIMNLGISGDTAQGVLNRIESEAQSRQNQKGLAIMIQVGSNNAAERNGQLRSTLEGYQDDLEMIITKARVFTDKIMVIGFPAVDEAKTNPVPWADLSYKNANIAKFENAASESAAKMRAPFVPVFKKFRPGMNAHDGLHPNDDGHQLIFELVRPALDELLAS